MGFSSYYDEEGNLHSHDPNKHSYAHHCSNGHWFSIVTLFKCPSCDFGGTEEIIESERNPIYEPLLYPISSSISPSITDTARVGGQGT